MTAKMYFRNSAGQTAYVCIPDEEEDPWAFIHEHFPALWIFDNADFSDPCCTHEITTKAEAEEFAQGAEVYNGGFWQFGKIKVTAHTGEGYGWLEVKNLSRHTIKIEPADLGQFYSCCEAMDRGESPQGWEDGNGRTVCEWWYPDLPDPIKGETAIDIFEELGNWGVYAGEPDEEFDYRSCCGEVREWAFVQEYRPSSDSPVTVKAVHRFPMDEQNIPDACDTKAWKDSLELLIVSWTDRDGIDYERAVR